MINEKQALRCKLNLQHPYLMTVANLFGGNPIFSCTSKKGAEVIFTFKNEEEKKDFIQKNSFSPLPMVALEVNKLPQHLLSSIEVNASFYSGKLEYKNTSFGEEKTNLYFFFPSNKKCELFRNWLARAF